MAVGDLRLDALCTNLEVHAASSLKAIPVFIMMLSTAEFIDIWAGVVLR